MNKNLKSFFALGVLSIFGFMLSACETADDSKLEQARSCIDTASRQVNSNPTAAQTKAAECDTLVTNMTSAESGKIGFGAMLIVEGKFSQIPTLVTALQANTDTLSTGFSYLVFASATNTTKMSTYATRSNSTGIQKIAGLISSANFVASLGGLSSTPTVAQVKTAVAGITAANANTPGTTEYQLAQSLITLQQTSCSGASSTSTNCTKITQAVGSNTSDPVAVLNAFKTFVAASN